MDRDGSNKTNLTNDLANDRQPAYSPDGSRIAFVSERSQYGIHTMDSTGAGVTFLTTGENPDWQPIPINSYPHPRGASPMQIPLVPANTRCDAPNHTHGIPLAFPSCAPPTLTSSYLTVGTPDSNGKRTTMEAYILLKAIKGDPDTPEDEADVSITVHVNNVFNKDLSDYTGSLRAELPVTITDHNSLPSPGGAGAGTLVQVPLPFVVPCTADPDPLVGSDCTMNTTMDALAPGTVLEGLRSSWAIGQAQVFDGGLDGNALTADNTLFAVQGIFVP
jgi:hypothetical protein